MRDRLPLTISITALVVAVLGTTPLGQAAYEAVVPTNSVGAAQLRTGAVTEAKLRGDAVTSGKVKNRSLKMIDFAEGQIPAAPAGAKGDKGDKGSKGEIGAPGLSGYEIVNTNVAVTAASFASATVTCPAGKKALGGGFVTVGPYGPDAGPFPIQSNPSGNGTGWHVLVGRSPAASWTETFYAICATVAP
jgi:hypothetical protein